MMTPAILSLFYLCPLKFPPSQNSPFRYADHINNFRQSDDKCICWQVMRVRVLDFVTNNFFKRKFLHSHKIFLNCTQPCKGNPYHSTRNRLNRSK